MIDKLLYICAIPLHVDLVQIDAVDGVDTCVCGALERAANHGIVQTLVHI